MECKPYRWTQIDYQSAKTRNQDFDPTKERYCSDIKSAISTMDEQIRSIEHPPKGCEPGFIEKLSNFGQSSLENLRHDALQASWDHRSKLEKQLNANDCKSGSSFNLGEW